MYCTVEFCIQDLGFMIRIINLHAVAGDNDDEKFK